MSDKTERELTTKQRAAIAALLCARDAKSAAIACGVAYRTLCRWMELPAFRAALRDAEGEIMGASLRRLTHATAAALDVLEDGMSASTPPALRLRAADITLAKLATFRELLDVDARLARLEAMAGGGVD